MCVCVVCVCVCVSVCVCLCVFVYCDSLTILECPQAPVVGEGISSSFSSATSCTHQSKHAFQSLYTCTQINTMYMCVPLTSGFLPTKILILSRYSFSCLYTCGLLLNLKICSCTFLKEGAWNRLVSHLAVKQITDRRRADELVRL